ncbi:MULTISPECIES: hypothetical protein [Burkholderia]|uniref:hypothetical protein n=1 Tax=Burkholderia TaxID=32008 RepID=UPI0005B6A6A4|nr:MULTISPECIES: hypothetical protein [Burkholderia]KIP14060.1 hypothetical protein KY49_1562 [Burkholderia sp. MSHR3999]
MTDDDPFRKIEEQLVGYSSDRWLTTYVECHEGAAVWAAYLEWRTHGLPIPETILSKFDEWAAKLLSASNGMEAAEILGLGPTGRSGTFRERIQDAAQKVDAMRYLSDPDGPPVTKRKQRAVVNYGRSRKTIDELAAKVGLNRGKRGRPKAR